MAKKRKKRRVVGNRRADRMHLRSIDELQFICTYIDNIVETLEEQQEKQLNKPKEEMQKILKQREKERLTPEEFQERISEVKALQEANAKKYKGKWFTNTINAAGLIDLDGDYKKIRVADFKKFMLDAEEKWAQANKERPLGGNQLTSDLTRCGVITTSAAKTHRPVDPFGERIGDENINQVMEYCISQLKFFSQREE